MQVTFVQIPIIALVCYLLLMVALLPARQNRQVRSFRMLLVCFVIWTGCSMLMYIMAWPGYEFWYMLSVVGLFLVPLAFYVFLREFVGAQKGRARYAVYAATLLLVVPTFFDLYLDAPIRQILPSGGLVFRYQTDLRILIPAVLSLGIVALAVRLARRHLREPGLSTVLLGLAILVVGNVVSIIPGNGFPWDTLAAIINAVLLFWALYRRRLFALDVFIAPGTLGAIAALIVCIIGGSVPRELLALFSGVIGPRFVDAPLILYWCTAAILAVLAYLGLMWLVKRFLLDRGRQRSLALRHFSDVIARNPSNDTLLQELTGTLRQMFGDSPACLFLLDESMDAFVPAHPHALGEEVKPIYRSDPCAIWFTAQSGCVRARQVQAMGVSVAPDKGAMMQKYNITCIVPFQDTDTLQGILFLGRSAGQKDYSDDDLVFLASLGAMASVGLKNARLYQRLYREARTDQLTGLLNRRAFTSVLEARQKARKPFALCMLDVDDFKLYNQLYGVQEGDRTLVRLVERMRGRAGEGAVLARYAGKVFVAILPGASGEQGLEFARDMCRIAADMAEEKLGRITLSCGVFGYTGAEERAAQMLEYVDMAVFHVKQSGKNAARIYAGQEEQSKPGTGEQVYASTVYAITAAVDAKDHYTFNHSLNVARYAQALAQAIGLDDGHVEMVYQAGLVHDVGKLAVPESILGKPGALTDAEFEIMKTHVESAVAIIRNLPSMDYVVPAAITHHERWDGMGYPRGLSGEEIPIGGRCLALADAFDAMVSVRTYKSAYTVEYALEEIEAQAGKQFDPALCPVFVRLVKEGLVKVTPQQEEAHAG